MAKKNAETTPEPTFEELLAEAESLAERMEDGGLSLDQSITAYEKGVANLRRCSAMLRSAEEKVKILLEANGAFRLEELDAEPDKDSDDDDAY